MIETWKYLHGQYHVNHHHKRTLYEAEEGEVSQAPAKKLFQTLLVNRWNMLTENIVTSPSVNIFKNRLDTFWYVHKCEQSDDFPCTRTNTRQDQVTGYSPTCMYNTYFPHTIELTNQLEMVQRRAARFVTADYRRRHSVTVLLNQLQWQFKPSFSVAPTVKSPCYTASITNL